MGKAGVRRVGGESRSMSKRGSRNKERRRQ